MNRDFIDFVQGLQPDDKRKARALERGKVLVPPPDTKIQIRDITLEKDDVIFSNFLLKNYKRIVDLEGEEEGILKNFKMVTKNEVRAGDQVVMMPFADGQMWYVFDVVSLPNETREFPPEAIITYADRSRLSSGPHSEVIVTPIPDQLPDQENNLD